MDLLAQLFNSALEVEPEARQSQVRGLGTERVGLAVELLAQEVEASADRPAAGQKPARRFDGHLRAYAAGSGAVIWDFDTNRAFESVSGAPAHGGSIESDGPVIAHGHVLVNSGYLFGGRMPGNVLLAFALPGEQTQ